MPRLVAVCVLAAAAPVLADEAPVSLLGTWLYAELQESVTDHYGGDRKVSDIGIEGYRFALEATPLSQIAAELGATVHRIDKGSYGDVWLCLSTPEQALYIYSLELDQPETVNKVVLDNRGPAPATAGCGHRSDRIALDMGVLAPGTALAIVQEQYGLAMPEQTGTFGYRSREPSMPGPGRVTWQEVAYHATDGVVDAYAVLQQSGQ